MEAFLKKYSSVPNGFIEDFFSIAKEKYDDNELVIKFDVVVKWLSVEKKNLKRLLVKKCTEGKDYIITIEKVDNINGPSSNYVENIMITPLCFKFICMSSQTKKADAVKNYYLSVESLVKRYHDKIVKQMNDELKRLLNNQKTKYITKKGVVYILRALNGKLNLYKIGKAKDLAKRLKGYNTGNADDIGVLFALEVDDITKVEECIKAMIKDKRYRKNKEIYEIDLDVLKKVFIDCDELHSKIRKYFIGDKSQETNKNFKEVAQNGGKVFVYFSE